jgi:hypothetical protein
MRKNISAGQNQQTDLGKNEIPVDKLHTGRARQRSSLSVAAGTKFQQVSAIGTAHLDYIQSQLPTLRDSKNTTFGYTSCM